MKYYVMQVIKGQVYAHGPYASEQARDNRMQKVVGGEVLAFNSFKVDAEEAIREFKDEQARGL